MKIAKILKSFTITFCLSVILANFAIAASDQAPPTITVNTNTSSASISESYIDFNGIAYGSSRFIAVGSNGTIVKSEDGSNWTECNSGIKNNLTGVIWAKNQFIAFGSAGMILTSTDGEKWIKRISDTVYCFYDGACNDSKIVLVGQNGIILTSADAVNWEMQKSDTADHITCITWNGNKFITGEDTELTSTDGETWTCLNSDYSLNITDIAWWENKFWALKSYGLIDCSGDGKTWVNVFKNDNIYEIFDLICSSPSTMIVVGRGYILASNDGTTWNKKTIYDSDTEIKGMIWAKNKFIGVGESGKIITSSDGAKWSCDTITFTPIEKTEEVKTEVKENSAIEKVSLESGAKAEEAYIKLILKPGFDVTENGIKKVTITDEEENNVFETYGYLGGIETIDYKNVKGLNISLNGTFEQDKSYKVDIQSGFLKDDAGNINEPYSFTVQIKANQDENESEGYPAIVKASPSDGGVMYLSQSAGSNYISLYLEEGFDITEQWNGKISIVDQDNKNVFKTYGYIGGIETRAYKNRCGLRISLYGDFELNKQYTVNIEKGFIKHDYGHINKPFSFKFKVKTENKFSGELKFKDVPINHWAYNAIANMSSKAVISGFPDETFKPDEYITRSEFAKIMTSALNLEIEEGEQTYKDVDKEAWDYKYVETVKNYLKGYTYGSGNYFKGDQKIRRDEAAVALVKAMGFEEQTADVTDITNVFSDQINISLLVKDEVIVAYKNNIISGYEDGTFRPFGSLTRAEAAMVLFRIMERFEN